MRRRQAFAEKANGVSFGEWRPDFPPDPPKEIAKWTSASRVKGVCPKCKKRIGRGIAGHMKACK